MPIIVIGSEEQFKDELKKAGEKLVVVDFTATWCGPCQRISPVFETLSDKFKSTVFLKVDVDDTPEVAQSNEVRAMPTFVFMKLGKEMDRIQGADANELEQKIKQHGCPASGPQFSGSGHRLGGEPSTSDTQISESESKSSSSSNSNANMGGTAEDLEKAQEAMKVDESKPTAKINIRLADGTRSTLTLNSCSPVSLIREFICTARPDQSSRDFALVTSFPTKEVEDESRTIEDAKLANAVVMQKLK